MSEAIKPRRQRRPGLGVGVVVGVGALAASCGAVVAGASPAALLIIAVASTTLALRCWLTTALALATVLSAALVLVAVAMPLLPVLGLPVSSVLAIPAVAAAVGLAVLGLRRTVAFKVSKPDLALGAGLVALSLVQVVAVPVTRWLTDSPKLAWMMKNDATWNLLSSRFVVEDGGLVASSHRNPAPLANELVALFISPGRSALDRADLLAHDLHRSAEALLLLVGATSLLAGLLVASALPASRPWSRAALAVVGAMIPWTWSFAGQVFVFGFWNSLPAAILLLAAWAAWTSSERHPTTSSGVLALVGTGLLAAWSPLVLVPACLGLAVVVWRRQAHLELRGLRLVAWLVPLVVLVAYAGLVTQGDFVAASGGLAAEGGFPDYGEHLPLVYVWVPVAVLLLLSVLSSVRVDLVGVVVLGLAGVIGTLYLMAQRAESPLGPWGYYPQKFAWALSMLAPTIVLMAVSGALAGAGLRRVQRCSLVVGTILLAGVLLLQVPPSDPRPLTVGRYPVPHRTPDFRLSSLLLAVSIAMPDRASAVDPAVPTLLRLEDPDSKVVVSRWFPDPGLDGFVNFWLLQLPVDRADEQPRGYAYVLDSTDPVMMCDLVRDWGDDVVIHTRSATLGDEMAKLCPRQDFDVRLG